MYSEAFDDSFREAVTVDGASSSSKVKDSIHTSMKSPAREEEKDDDIDFVVSPTESLDDWIDEESFDGKVSVTSRRKKQEQEAVGKTPQTVDKTTDFRCIFMTPPLGLTLSRGADGSAEVSKLKSDGQASSFGIMVGDRLIAVEPIIVEGYDDAMLKISQKSYPLSLVFRRGTIHSILHKTGDAIVKGSNVCLA